ncbi:IS3 family transposase [Nocardia sp. NPDC052112]|uniref:IS3 family transposase n=1 Tax=Nocardia sp. NPDC052112 TaxID=3155646 RepID=UPI00342B6BB8
MTPVHDHRNAQWPLFAVGLRDIHPPDRHRLHDDRERCTRTATSARASAESAVCPSIPAVRRPALRWASYREAHSHTRLRVAQHECYYRHTYATKTELIAAVDNWMHFYNHRRRHSAIGMRSPIDYEQSLKTTPEAS